MGGAAHFLSFGYHLVIIWLAGNTKKKRQSTNPPFMAIFY
jgi:hypothetical protein